MIINFKTMYSNEHFIYRLMLQTNQQTSLSTREWRELAGQEYSRELRIEEKVSMRLYTGCSSRQARV
jgi:hypothetical protein